MKIQELRQFSPAQLLRRLAECKREAHELRVAVTSGQEKNVRKIRALRREGAQVATLLHQQGK